MLRTIWGGLVLFGLLLLLLAPVLDADRRRQLLATARTMWERLPGGHGMELIAVLPDDRGGLARGMLVTRTLPDGSEEAVAEVVEAAISEEGARVTLRVFPQKEHHFTARARLKVVYPPESMMQAARTLFSDEELTHIRQLVEAELSAFFGQPEVQAELQRVVDETMARVGGSERTRAILNETLLPALEEAARPHMYGVLGLFGKRFDQRYPSLLDKGRAMTSLTDPEEASQTLGPLLERAVWQYRRDHEEELFADVAAVAGTAKEPAMALLAEEIWPWFKAEVLPGLVAAHGQHLLNRIGAIVGEQVMGRAFTEGGDLTPTMAYLVRNRALIKRETKLVLERAGMGRPLASGNRLAWQAYWVGGSDRIVASPE